MYMVDYFATVFFSCLTTLVAVHLALAPFPTTLSHLIVVEGGRADRERFIFGTYFRPSTLASRRTLAKRDPYTRKG